MVKRNRPDRPLLLQPHLPHQQLRLCSGPSGRTERHGRRAQVTPRLGVQKKQGLSGAPAAGCKIAKRTRSRNISRKLLEQTLPSPGTKHLLLLQPGPLPAPHRSAPCPRGAPSSVGSPAIMPPPRRHVSARSTHSHRPWQLIVTSGGHSCRVCALGPCCVPGAREGGQPLLWSGTCCPMSQHQRPQIHPGLSALFVPPPPHCESRREGLTS